MATFLTLPNELLQQIASALPYQSFQNLTKADRRLRNACNDQSVLRSIARHGFQNDPLAMQRLSEIFTPPKRTKLEPKQLDWTQGDLFLADSSLSSAKRVAFAIQSCFEASLANDEDWASKVLPGRHCHDFCEWLPHLIALQHPAVLTMEPRTLIRIQTDAHRVSVGRAIGIDTIWRHVSVEDVDYNFSETSFYCATFSLTYLVLQRLETTLDTSEIVQQFLDEFLPGGWDAGQIVAQDMIIALLQGRIPNYGTLRSPLSTMEASMLFHPLILGLATQFSIVDQLCDLPRPSKMCLYNYMDVPPLYDNGSATGFSTCHLSRMTQPAFLSDRWHGYYSDERVNTGRLVFDPQMHDITILATHPTEEATLDTPITAHIDGRSRGVDAIGDFTLQGEVYQDGSVSLLKRYIHAGFSWSWTGRVTPFGIVGRWGANEDFGGHFWIWKQEWR